jgi:hypothetical protein
VTHAASGVCGSLEPENVTSLKSGLKQSVLTTELSSSTEDAGLFLILRLRLQPSQRALR